MFGIGAICINIRIFTVLPISPGQGQCCLSSYSSDCVILTFQTCGSDPSHICPTLKIGHEVGGLSLIFFFGGGGSLELTFGVWSSGV